MARGRKSAVKAEGEESPTGPPEPLADNIEAFGPNPDTAFLFLCLIRVAGALLTCPSDCDEVYNYWEPLHYLVHGSGMQTWEYAPQFALRSYAYLLPSVLVEHLTSFVLTLAGFFDTKFFVWMGIRGFWAVLSAAAEVHLYKAAKTRLGGRVGILTLLLSGGSAGMFSAAPALLPSSTAMILTTIMAALWMEWKWNAAIFVGALCVLGTGWPFVAVLMIPFTWNCLRDAMTTGGASRVAARITWGLMCFGAVGAVTYAVDSRYYGIGTWPNFNIVKYNALSQGKGDELYGVEPWTYYVKNLLINTSCAAPLALLLPVVMLLNRWDRFRPSLLVRKMEFTRSRAMLMFAMPAYLWLAVMFAKPHKEERFLYPAYPFLFVGAAAAVDSLTHLLNRVEARLPPSAMGKQVLKDVHLMLSSGVVAFALGMGSIRAMAVTTYHTGHCGVLKQAFNSEFRARLAQPESAAQRLSLCVGEDWHRFPSSYFLPDKVELRFIKTGYTGQLPQPFSADKGTSAVPRQPFNDLNKEETSRYTALSDCDYVMDTIWRTRTTDLIAEMKKSPEDWGKVTGRRIIDKQLSDPALRAFYIPFLSRSFVVYGQVTLFRRLKLAKGGKSRKDKK
eukprot:TRINITY_DN6317_c0_g1_i2.p1 TRINITY_DN6317_c0_g1~~TRINITY_DN6317_c0_g1_i2.p1  ORF type:complete len:649 (-),score=169.20 TRINITY_DN6317_c0_g1_i2:49-1899(-)